MAVIKFIEISRELNITENKDYKLREVYINPEHVVFMREDYNKYVTYTHLTLPTKA